MAMDMSFQRHAAFELKKEKPDAQSGQPLDYARLIALAQKSTAYKGFADNVSASTLLENSDHIHTSQDDDLKTRIALIAGAGDSLSGDARSTIGCGAFLDRSTAFGCGPNHDDENAKSKSPVYLDHLANSKASTVERSNEQDQS